MCTDGCRDLRPKVQPFLMRSMSLSLYGIPDGQSKGQSKAPCPSVHAPTSALGSLSSVALSSAPVTETLAAYLTATRISVVIRKLFRVLFHLRQRISFRVLFYVRQ